MILLIIVASLFYRTAKRKKLNGALWGFLAVLMWFGAQFFAAFILVMSESDALLDDGSVTIWTLGSSIVGTIILYVLLEMAAKKKLGHKAVHSDDIMDDTNFDDL